MDELLLNNAEQDEFDQLLDQAEVMNSEGRQETEILAWVKANFSDRLYQYYVDTVFALI